MYPQTVAAYTRVLKEAKETFLRKTGNYGASWLVFRLSSLTDQIFIKARRIRRLEEMTDRPAVPEGPHEEYQGILNYAVMALMRLWQPTALPAPAWDNPASCAGLPPATLSALYDQVAERLRALMERKNHDYGEAWRGMRLSSITDHILVRVFRLKHLEDHPEQSDEIDRAEIYADIANYAVFALIRLAEEGPTTTCQPGEDVL
ncbi:MAG: DUF1599 domain-containing protein [Firmicutes bacterium]|nr:DUF1599 domain-containing protein [Bacillota bacterium]